MKSFSSKIFSFIIVTTCGFFASNVSAVNINHQGVGQALIYPYYTVRNGQVGLLSVENNSTTPKEVRVQIYEGLAGQAVLSFNVYLSSEDTWTVFMTNDNEGVASIITGDISCTVPTFPPSTLLNLRDELYKEDAGDNDSKNRLQEGYIEIIELSQLSGEHAEWSNPSSDEFNCTKIMNSWVNANGVWRDGGTVDTAAISGPGSISGSFNIVDPLVGSSASYSALALANFDQADNNHIIEPGDLSFNLSHAGDSNGEVVSKVVINGDVITSHWENDSDGNGQTGLDAVSAVLMHSGIMNNFSSEHIASMGTYSDWVISQPTKNGYVKGDGSDALGPYTAALTGDGACEPVEVEAYSREGIISAGYPVDNLDMLCWNTTTLSFNNDSTLSSLLNSRIDTNTSTGKLKLGLGLGLEGVALVSDEGHEYFGLPAVGFLVQEFIDSDSSDKASYMGLYQHKYKQLLNVD